MLVNSSSSAESQRSSNVCASDFPDDVHRSDQTARRRTVSIRCRSAKVDWSRYITPLMFAVRDTPQYRMASTPFELLFGHRVRTSMTLLKHLWTGEKEDLDCISVCA